MDNFRTIVNIEQSPLQISHAHKIFLLGSCFAGNIGAKFHEAGFHTLVNPFGVLYNPSSIATKLQHLVERKNYQKEDLTYYNNKWFSWLHDTSFAFDNKENSLEKINRNHNKSIQFLASSDILFITFGTSWVFSFLNKIVANCHKLPDKLFNHFQLSIQDIVNQYINLISELKYFNKKIKICFTVSPVRHWKDGAHGNQLSKAVLLLAIDEIIRKTENTFYFPAYEILLDELRDYRFFSEDMIHPSSVAVNYIWERFSETFFDKITLFLNLEINKLQSALKHKPFNSNSLDYKLFITKNIERCKDLQLKYPYISIDKLVSAFQDILHKIQI